jgi:rhodanese-related sulfurtransferase
VTVTNHPASAYQAVVDPATQLIDVRQPDEVAAGGLPGAVNIPLDELPSRIDELDPQRRTVMLCRSGARSARAADYLVDAGFTNVVNLDGGMISIESSDGN